LGLAEAVRIALANNPETAATGWDYEAAQAQSEYAWAQRLPTLSLSSGYAHYLHEQPLAPGSQPGGIGIQTHDIASGSLVLRMPIFTGGRLVNQMRAADLLQQAAGHRLARNREQLVFNVSSVFFNILAQQQVIASLAFSFKALQEHLKNVEALIEAGEATRVDRLRTEVRLAEVQQRLVQEKNTLAIAQRTLATVLGLPEQTQCLSLRGQLEVRKEPSVPSLEAATTAAWSGRADYLAAKSTLEAQARQVDVARAGHWPTISLQGSYGGRWAVGPTTGSGDTFNNTTNIGASMDIPLLDAGQVDAQVRQQRANLAAAQERLRELELQIRLDVETALLNVHSSWQRIEAVHKSVEQAEEGFRMEREKYDLGEGALVNVLDAQTALLEAQTTYYQALASLHTALAQLRLATGQRIEDEQSDIEHG
jgi:TolC family type I secretion outer membrane protein